MSMQKVLAIINDELLALELPAPEEAVMPGIQWGKFDNLFTPAYWASQLWMSDFRSVSHKLGNTLEEEITCCLLGGYGIPAEVGLAAYDRLKQEGITNSENESTEVKIRELLSAPLMINGKPIRYRFANQKAEYVASALQYIKQAKYIPTDHHAFREFLLQIKGVGLKTASWITRNWFNSDAVAILDVHIIRAGKMMKLYRAKDLPSTRYLEMEKKFLDFSAAIKARPADLDAIMWNEMKFNRRIAISG